MRNNEGREGGIYGSRTVAIEVFLLFNFAVVFNFNVFPFPPTIGVVLMHMPKTRQQGKKAEHNIKKS